jgi:hypothetical protein
VSSLMVSVRSLAVGGVFVNTSLVNGLAMLTTSCNWPATVLLSPPYVGTPPSHHRAIGAQRGKGPVVENTCVTSIVPSSAPPRRCCRRRTRNTPKSPPSHRRAARQRRTPSKTPASRRSCRRAPPPRRCCRRRSRESPQVTTEPSARSAAKAYPVENTCVTSIVPSSAAATALLSPPRGISPGHHRAIGAQRGKGIPRRKHLRHVDRAVERRRHGAAVAAVRGIPPGHHRAIGAQRGKGIRRKHLRHVDRAVERRRDRAAVAAVRGIPPGHHRAIGAQCGKGQARRKHLRHVDRAVERAATALLSPPYLDSPRSPPSHRRAARQRRPVENTCVTSIVPSSDAATALLSPPYPESPQVTTEPSARSAAKASQVENTCVTSIVPSSFVATALLSPP